MSDDRVTGREYVVAVVMATEVPPVPQAEFTAEMIPLALRAVANVIRNRTVRPGFPEDPVSVVLAPKQFSAVCREPYWRDAMAGRWQPNHVRTALQVWRASAIDRVSLVPGATHYYSPISMIPRGSSPTWAAGMDEVLVPGLSREYFRFYKPRTEGARE